MSASQTDYLEARNRGLVFGNTGNAQRPSTLYLAWFTATPSDTGGGTEYTGNGYARKAIACTSSNWTVTDATVTNAAAIKFANAATADWTGITHWGLFDKATGGNLLWYGSLKETRTFTQYSTANVPAGEFAITLGGSYGTWMANKVLKYNFQGATWVAVPTFYFGIGTNADAEQLYGEPVPYAGSTASAYARGSIANTTAKWPSSTSGSNATSNASSIANYPDATADWGQLSYQAILDAAILTTPTYTSSVASVSASVTYNQSGTTITVSKTSHGLNTGDAVNLTFTAGTGGTGASGYYVVTVVDANSFTVTSAVSATITGSASASWVPMYIEITQSAHGLATTNTQTGNAQHVDLWFQTKSGASYFTSRRYYVSSVSSSSVFRVNLNSDDTQITNTSSSVYASVANLIGFCALTTAITVNSTDTTTAPANAITASFD